MSALQLEGLCAGYGRANIVEGVSLHVDAGEIVALVGPNGAGKSTLLKAVAGAARMTGGTLRLGDTNLEPLSTSQRSAAGAAFMPQDRNVFRTLSVEENLETSAWGHSDISERKAEVLRMLPTIEAYRRQPAGSLSGGQRQMTALGMTLMTRPRFLLVDEPTAGLSPNLVADMLDTLKQLATTAGLGILIVEQNARAALQKADRALVLVDGRVKRAGPALDIVNEPDFGALFFGEVT